MNPMSPERLKSLLDANADIELIDIRENYERMQANIGGKHIPMADLFEMLGGLPKDKEVVIYCNSGQRGEAVQHCLERKGFENISNLDGGLRAWCEEIDPQLSLD